MGFEPDEMLMQIFRSEVESHSESLTSSLLALEQDTTSTTTLDRLMRAAHSIKGAARIVRVHSAADVAHVMEDCFVAAQKGRLKLAADDVDILLRGVNLLVKISAATQDPAADRTAFESSVQAIVAELKQTLEGRPAETSPSDSPAQVSPPVTPAVAPSAPLGSSKSAPERRVTVITCPEFLDDQAAETARRQLLSALDAGSNEIQLDLATTRDLDAIGLAFLAAVQQFIAARPHTSLRFQPVSTDMQTVLQLTGLDARASRVATL